MKELFYDLYPYALTVLITMAAMGYDFGTTPPWGIW